MPVPHRTGWMALFFSSAARTLRAEKISPLAGSGVEPAGPRLCVRLPCGHSACFVAFMHPRRGRTHKASRRTPACSNTEAPGNGRLFFLPLPGAHYRRTTSCAGCAGVPKDAPGPAAFGYSAAVPWVSTSFCTGQPWASAAAWVLGPPSTHTAPSRAAVASTSANSLK